MPILATVALSVLAMTAAPPARSAQTVVMLPFQNISGTEGAPEAVSAELTRCLAAKGYRVVRGEPVDEFLAAEKIRYLDSLPSSRREKLLQHFEAGAVVLGDVFEFAGPPSPVVGLSARMIGADGHALWSAVAARSAEDTKKVFGVGKLMSLEALASKTVDVLTRDLPEPGAGSPLEGARAKPVDLPSPRTYRSAALTGSDNLVCVLPLENLSKSRVAPRVVGELLAQRLAASKVFRAVEPADFREAMWSTGVYGIRTGDPQELTKLGAKLGTTLFLKGTILRYQDVLPGSSAQTPELELQLQLVDVAAGKVLWTSSLARQGTDYSGLLQLGAISNAAVLSDQVVAEIISSVEHTEGTGRPGVKATIIVADKTYDGSNAATVTSCTLSGAASSDVAKLRCSAASASFSDPKAGAAKTVTVAGLTLSGDASSRYVLNSEAATTTASIRPKPVIATVSAGDKTYDGTPAAAIKSCTITGLLPAESAVVACSAARGSFEDPNAGSGKTVTAGGITLSGAGSSNYVPSPATATTTATIRRKPLTAEVTISGKTYDGTVAATVAACALPGVLPADAGGITCRVGDAAFGDAAAGNGKPVAVTGVAVSGASSSNYALVKTTAETSADIAPKTVGASIAATDKIYDGTPSAPIAICRLTGALESYSGEVGCEASESAFSDKNVGAKKPVVASISLTGAAAGNYALDSLRATTTANISPRKLTPSGVIARDKSYDGTTAARLDIDGATLPDEVPGDDVALDDSRATATFADKDAGPDKVVAVFGLNLVGSDAGNYTLEQAAPHAAITPRPAEPHIAAADKVYDGTTAAELTGKTISGIVWADAESVRLEVALAAFDTKNVGTGRTVTATGLSLAGESSRNYALSSASARTKASISPRHVTGTFTVADKRYDGNPWVAVRTRSISGAIPGDVVKLSGGRGRFADATAGTGKTVTLEGAKLAGPDSGNYVLDTVAPTTADIIALTREPQ